MLGTANTMSCLAEALGMSLPGCGLAHAVSAKKRRIAKQSGRRIVEMVEENLTPRRIVTREALRNGIKVSMAMGASTNSTLHLPAIAHEAGIDLSLNDFDELSREIPYLCNIKPSGQYPLSVLEEQGGVPAVMKAIADKLDLEQMTVNGKTVGENLAQVELVANDVIFPLAQPRKRDRREAWQFFTEIWRPAARWSNRQGSSPACTILRGGPVSLPLWRRPAMRFPTTRFRKGMCW